MSLGAAQAPGLAGPAAPEAVLVARAALAVLVLVLMRRAGAARRRTAAAGVEPPTVSAAAAGGGVRAGAGQAGGVAVWGQRVKVACTSRRHILFSQF